MKLYAESVLIGNQWQTDKSIFIDDRGYISAIVDGHESGAEIVKGPLIPGMVNCHSHAFQRAFAGLSEYRANRSDSFWSWRDIMYRFVAKLTPEDVFHIAQYLYAEMLMAGYTTVAEFHYLHHQVGGRRYKDPAEMSLQVIEAAKTAGIAITHLPVLYSYAGFGEKAPTSLQSRFIHGLEDYCELVDKLCRLSIDEETVRVGIAPHSLRAVSQSQLDKLIPFIKAIDSQAPVHIHIAEQVQEVDDCIAFYKQRPVDWLLNRYDVDSSWCLIHATHLESAEISLLAESRAVAGICPSTEANLGDGIFAAHEYLAAHGKFAIGSDSHISVNVAEELRLLEYAQRLTLQQRAVLTTNDCPSVGQNLYTQAARHGASVVNQNVGCIDIGKRADLIVLDGQNPNIYGKHERSILDAAVFACDQLPVKNVMVAGSWKVENGIHQQQEGILSNYLKVMDKLL